MRKLIAIAAVLSLLAACGPNPAAGNNPAGSNGTGTGTGTDTPTGTGTASGALTKQVYLNFLNCIKAKVPADAQAAINANIAAVNAVPDSTWAQVSASLTTQYQVWLNAYGSACK